jgi:hypothetical protein
VTRFRADYEVVSSSVLDENLPTFSVNVPDSGFSVSFRNATQDDNGHVPNLIASVIGTSESISAAADEFRNVLARCLDVLTFSTHAIFKIYQCILVMDWEPFQKERHVIFQRKFGTFEPPSPDIVSQCAATTQAVLDLNPPVHIERALQWFRYAIIGEQPEEQFQYFWLAMEVIAEATRTKDKVEIPCAECGSHLECSSCHHIPTRIPMPQQEIRNWADKIYGTNGPAIFRTLNSARNHLLHGGSRESLAAKLKVPSTDVIINTAGYLAWHMIFGAMKFPTPPPFFSQGGDFVTKSLIFSSDLSITYDGIDEQPSDDAIPKLAIQMKTKFGLPITS